MTPKKRLNILLADDGSQHARAAVELLGIIPPEVRTRVLVLRAFDSGQITSLSEIERALNRTVDHLAVRGFRVEKELRLISPTELILNTAESRNPDLIVLGAKGLRSTMGILLGGVAQNVMEHACCPVLIVRAPFQGLRRILLVVDGSLSSQSAARYLATFPLPDGVDVRVMHVMPPLQTPIVMEPFMGGWQTSYTVLPIEEEEKKFLAQHIKTGRALLKRTLDLLNRHGLGATPELVRGDAATEIIDYVKTNQVDLIIAGSRGLGNFQGWLMGSVSRKLIHYAPCSVLIVKERQKGA